MKLMVTCLLADVGHCGTCCGEDSTFVCRGCGRELCYCQQGLRDGECAECWERGMRRANEDIDRALALGERYA